MCADTDTKSCIAIIRTQMIRSCTATNASDRPIVRYYSYEFRTCVRRASSTRTQNSITIRQSSIDDSSKSTRHINSQAIESDAISSSNNQWQNSRNTTARIAYQANGPSLRHLQQCFARANCTSVSSESNVNVDKFLIMKNRSDRDRELKLAILILHCN